MEVRPAIEKMGRDQVRIALLGHFPDLNTKCSHIGYLKNLLEWVTRKVERKLKKSTEPVSMLISDKPLNWSEEY